MLRVEFHCHTIYSKDCLVTPAQLVEWGRRKHVERIIVTDNNSIAGALAARELDPDRIIVGEEIMTTAGEILAAFVQLRYRPGSRRERRLIACAVRERSSALPIHSIGSAEAAG